MSRFGMPVFILAIGLFIITAVSPALSQDTVTPVDEAGSFNPDAFVPAEQFVVDSFWDNGRLINKIVVPGRPPKDYRAPVAVVPNANIALGINVLPEVPAFDWCYGCSATSAAMMMGYYDRHGYPNMYAGPTNGGVCPLNNSAWGSGECPLSATHMGKDGLAIKGHVDDYWISYGSSGADPYITGGWTQHTYGDCTGDYMGTNQSALGCSDGATTFYYDPSGNPLCNYNPGGSSRDGCYGMRQFVQSRGYTVVNNCFQTIVGYNGNSTGFSFAQYCAEIDAGRPVMIQISGHSMVGYGYNTTGSIVYIHDTWDYNEHTMVWGGSYSGMQHYGVTTFQLAAAPQAILTDADSKSVPEGGTAAIQVKLSSAPSGNVTVSVAHVSGDSDITVQSGSSLTFNTSNWNTYQTVTLAAAQDIDGENGSATIRCSASGWTTKDVTAYEVDDEREILINPTSLNINEGGSGIFYVKLKGQPASTMNIGFFRASGDTDIYIQSGSTLTFTTSNWDTYQPVTIAANQDADGVDDSAVIRCNSQTWSSTDVNVTVADDDSMTIGQIKKLGDGSAAYCRSAVVTAVFGDSFYLEAEDRSAGIRAYKLGHGVSVGMKVGFSGTVRTANAERYVDASSIVQSGSGIIKPLHVSNRSIGSVDGLSNAGLLVSSYGKVIQQQSATSSQIRFWNFDTNPGWTFQSQWAWGVPTGSGSYNRDPISGYTGTNVVGYNLYGDYTDNMSSTMYATTPAIDCSSYSSVRLRFYRWLGVESSSFDHANIQASKDGANWTTVWNHASSNMSESSWSYQDYDISAVADRQSTVYLRWGMGTTDTSVTYPGWNIDDVEITGNMDPYFVIQDGSNAGLKVLAPTGVTLPPVDTYVSVTGISYYENPGTSALKLRYTSDIRFY